MDVMSVDDLVGDGFVFIWVTNKQFSKTNAWMEKQGWEVAELIVWKKVDS